MKSIQIKIILVIVSLGLLGSIVSTISEAQVPKKINYQGYLQDSVGNPVNGTLQMTLAIYDAATGGTALWSETQNISVNNGIYNVLLGTVTPITLPEAKPYWLGVKIGADSEMTPRQELTSAIYSLFVDGITIKDGKVGIGTNSPLASFHNNGDFITKGPWIDVRAYSSFKDAIDDIGSDDKTLLIPDEQIVSANIEVPPNVSLKFLSGGSLNISEGVVVTINGSIDAGPYKIFSRSGNVSIPNIKIIANWFGFDPSQTAADNAFYISKALNAGENAIEGGGSVVEIGKKGVYECDSFTIASNFLTLQGPGYMGGGVKLKYRGASSFINVDAKRVSIRDLYIIGPDAADGNGDIGIDIQDLKSKCTIENLSIVKFDIGIRDDGFNNTIQNTQILYFGTYGAQHLGGANWRLKDVTITNSSDTGTCVDLNHVTDTIMDRCVFGQSGRGVNIDGSSSISFYTCHWEGPTEYDVNIAPSKKAHNARILIVGSRLNGILKSASSKKGGAHFILIGNTFKLKPKLPDITDATGSKFYMLGNRELSSVHFTQGDGAQYWLDALPISEDGSIETLHARTTNRSKNVIIAENTGTSVHRPEYVAKSDFPGIGLLETDGNADENFHIRVDAGKLHIGSNNDSFNAFRSKITVQQDGKVGVGTSSPAYELEVSGAVILEDSSTPLPASGHSGIYSSSGELYTIDSGGNTTQLSPHDKETGEWIFYSKNVKTGRVVRINMEKLVKRVEELTGEKFMEEWIEK